MNLHQQLHTPGVLVIGSSLLLEGAAASLTMEPGIRVMTTQCTIGETEQQIDALCPRVILFELDQPCAAEIMVCRRALGETLLIGLDETNNRLVVLPCIEKVEPTTADLCQVVLDAISCPEATKA